MDRRSLGKRAVKRVSSTFASFPGESAAVDLASTGPQACGPAGNASNSEEYQDQADEGLKYDSEDDSQDDDDMENVSPSLTESLCDWAVHFRVSLVALTALLAILRVYHPFLPNYARTLLNTVTSYTIQVVAGGTYHYIGILKAFAKSFERIWCHIPNRH